MGGKMGKQEKTRSQKVGLLFWLHRFSQRCHCQSLNCVRLFLTPWTAACQASLPLTISWSSLKFMSIESVMPCNCLILCCPLLLLPSIFPNIRVFSDESAFYIRWPKYWNFSFIPSSEYSVLISFSIDQFDHLAVQGTLIESCEFFHDTCVIDIAIFLSKNKLSIFSFNL